MSSEDDRHHLVLTDLAVEGVAEGHRDSHGDRGAALHRLALDDGGQDAENRRKHGVPFALAQRAFLDPRRIIAVLLGFAGVLAIIRPGSDAFTPAMLLALAAALGGAIFQLLTRKVAGRQSAMASLFYPWAIATVLCTPFAFYRWTPPVTAVEWLLVALITGLSLTGNTLLVRSYQYGPASLIAPFIYLQLIWAALFGWLIFSAFPDGWSLAGMITIVAAGLLLVPRPTLRDKG